MRNSYFFYTAPPGGGGSSGDSIETGESNFGGAGAPVTITMLVTQSDLSYKPFIQASANPTGDLGEVWTENVSVTQFRVHNSGPAVTTFDWEVKKV